MQTVEKMLAFLKSNPNVLGLVEYGSSHKTDSYSQGDYDLFVILQKKDHNVESLHFYVSRTPIDLNIRTLKEIQDLKFVKGFETALLQDLRNRCHSEAESRRIWILRYAQDDG